MYDKPLQHRWMQIGTLLACFLLLTVAGSVSAQSMWVFQAETDLGHGIGRADGSGWSASVASDNAGWLCSTGPGTTAFSGASIASFRMMIDNCSGTNDIVVRLDVRDSTSGSVIASRNIYRNEFLANSTCQDFSVNFTSLSGHALDFRTLWYDKAYINEDCVTVSSAAGTAGRTFNVSDHIVSTSFFHWYTSTGGQLSGPWRPLEGRDKWTGETSHWQDQIKQVMSANIDAMWVHLIPIAEQQRINLFTALSQLRAEGYDVPKVAPFLDPAITWSGTTIDVATTAGKDEFVNQYIRFFNQYYGVNTDQYADSYIEQIGGKVVLDTYALGALTNINSLTRVDVESRLQTAFGANHPVFNNGIRMVSLATPPALIFTDEIVHQFEINAYYYLDSYNGITSVQLKGGYWDQNVRSPGSCLKRDGGTHYTSAWNQGVANRATIKRAYIESWNEYDEGSGIYRANTGAPYITNGNPNTDTWSSTNDPTEYIKTTAAGAAQFNDTPDLDAKILWNNIPTVMRVGSTAMAQIVVRNQGDRSWRGADNFKFGEEELLDPVMFGIGRYPIDDTKDEIPVYGGIFRGRPITFTFQITAPATPGTYVTHWAMLQEYVTWFGQELQVPINVVPAIAATPSAPTDAGAYTTNPSVMFNWQAITDPYISIVGYNCQIGSTPGGNDVFDAYVGNTLSKTITGCLNGKTYYCRVQAKDSAGNLSSWSGNSDGILVDTAAPTAPGTPTDAGAYTQSTSVMFNWTASSDTGSGIAGYNCQIGITPGGHDVFDGYVGNTLSKTITGCLNGSTYYCRVQAKDNAGRTSSWSGNSNGITVVTNVGISIAAARHLPDSATVGLSSKVVTGIFGDCLYIEEPDRTSGIRLITSAMPSGLVIGSQVDVAGTLMTNAAGERYIVVGVVVKST